MIKVTEQDSINRHLEEKSIEEITKLINEDDKKVAIAIEAALPQLNSLITQVTDQLRNGGRLFYLGAGSGGRLSVLDAIELPTTYGIEKGMVYVILADGVQNAVVPLVLGAVSFVTVTPPAVSLVPVTSPVVV